MATKKKTTTRSSAPAREGGKGKADALLIDGGVIATLGDDNRVLYDHAVLCEDGLIAAVAPRAELRGRARQVIDASGKLVLPGFINAHMHFYSTLVRGLGKAAPSKDFVEVLNNLWWRLDKKLTLDDCWVSAMLPLVDAIRHGTTTLIDHHASPFAARGSLDRISRAVKEVGLRASLCYELSDRDGDKIARDGIDENVDFIKRCQKERDPQLTALFGLHAAFTLSDKTLAAAADAGRTLGAGFHIHVAEAKSDQDHSLAHHQMRVVERLHRHGILGEQSIAAHCVHVSEREMELLAASGTAVVHNPQSNMNNAVGVADVLALGKKGVLVGLGTDAMTVNMMEEMRAALWVRHLAAQNPSVGFVESLELLTRNNARIANRTFSPKVGELRQGYAADLAIVDYHAPTPLDDGTFFGHLAFGVSQSAVDTTIASGKVLMENKRLTLDLDEAELAAKARELATSLWERF